MKAKKRQGGGWAQDMKLKKLKAARAKWLENQQARQRPHEGLQLIANSACPAPQSYDSEGEDQGGLDAHG